MITCPWCGTTYLRFQSNCNNCGGPLARLAESEMQQAQEIPLPPPAPRPVSDRFVWRLLISDGWAIGSGIFLLLGLIFCVVGFALTLGIVTAFVGIPFLMLGLLFAGLGGAGFASRYNQARQTVLVLQQGEPIRGQLVSVERNDNVAVNDRNPWVLRYRFAVGGQEFHGTVTTLNDPDPVLRAGAPVCVLYTPTDPHQNTLYPHP